MAGRAVGIRDGAHILLHAGSFPEYPEHVRLCQAEAKARKLIPVPMPAAGPSCIPTYRLSGGSSAEVLKQGTELGHDLSNSNRRPRHLHHHGGQWPLLKLYNLG